MNFNEHQQYDNSSDAIEMWQAWQGQAKKSRMELLSDEKIDPVVQAHMTLGAASADATSFSFILEECELNEAEWEQHCIRSERLVAVDSFGLPLVPLRRSSHT